MGYLGFVFEDNNLHKILITETEKLNGNYIIGTKSRFNSEKCEFLFISNKLKLSEFLTFEKSNFKYAKISLTQKTFIDFQNLTMWFSSKKYKELRQLFEIHDGEESNEELVKKFLEIYGYFLKN